MGHSETSISYSQIKGFWREQLTSRFYLPKRYLSTKNKRNRDYLIFYRCTVLWSNSTTQKKEKIEKLRYFRFSPNLAHTKLIDLVNYVLSSSSRGVLRFTQQFSCKNGDPVGRILLRVLRRMKACIDEFRPNTSQANYFEGLWRTTSKGNPKIEVRKQ